MILLGLGGVVATFPERGFTDGKVCFSSDGNALDGGVESSSLGPAAADEGVFDAGDCSSSCK
jgi:hypothetical protein